MSRPPLPLGTMGEIRCYRLSGGKVRAIANYRDYDGITRRVERTSRSETQARHQLKEACRDRGRNDADDAITASTTVRALAERWFAGIQEAVEAGDRSPGTAQMYRDRLDNQVLPAIGALRLREVSVARVDRLLIAVRKRHGFSVAKTTRTVLSGVLGMAARHDAIRSNPVRDAGPLHSGHKEHHALDLEQVWDFCCRGSWSSNWSIPRSAVREK